MTELIRRDGLVGIGEMARLTGVPVRTIRFYCDEGLIHPHRSTGGHRIFDAAAVDRLKSVRRLRALGLGLTAITAVLAGEVPIDEALAAEQATLNTELHELLWRRATLAAAQNTSPNTRTGRLDLLAVVGDPRHAHDTLVTFWREQLAAAPPNIFDGFVTMNIPDPPADPTPEQVVAYAELVSTTTDPALAPAIACQLWRSDPATIDDPRQLLTGIAEACAAVDPLLTAGIPPRPGPELDHFLAAHATARHESDTPLFRQRIRHGANDSDPRIHRYWTLTGEIIATTTTGAALNWLHRALAQVPAPAGETTCPAETSAGHVVSNGWDVT
ncbi:MerR family transcriptional regulator [Nocardia sp. BMG111209]|uniref:MerR family transcriptional regulator n=1 Tax=Nocardia sp. BMG111209 TaxID=1160137 RepID=UPI0003709489|nr:MerR family transcriptional regulator [Nocardia sp. BMG111209]